MGLSINGYKAIVEMQFADFVSTGFNPIVNLLAKSHYRWLENADVVVRMPCGGERKAGPFHSQTNEAWFTKTPGLKVVYPAFPYDAKGLLNASINDRILCCFLSTNNCTTVSTKKCQRVLHLPLGRGCSVEGRKRGYDNCFWSSSALGFGYISK
jgi:pyruvate/2-oxoglutarate/acetoin dehydrogenase E1 component